MATAGKGSSLQEALFFVYIEKKQKEIKIYFPRLRNTFITRIFVSFGRARIVYRLPPWTVGSSRRLALLSGWAFRRRPDGRLCQVQRFAVFNWRVLKFKIALSN
jgi:hypothetical protein